MRLVSFSVQKYRSITKSERLVLGDLTVLVGANNDGKSNILQALVTGMRYLSAPTPPGRTVVPARLRRDMARHQGRYEWERDFPQSLQADSPTGRSIFDFVFEMTDDEKKEIQKRTGHKLNENLPVRLLFGQTPVPEFRVPKQRSGPAISEKRAEIRAFVAELVQVQYIAAVRTARSALEVVEDMVRREMSAHTQGSEYAKALEQLQAVQRPIVEEIASALQGSLSALLPEVQSVEIELEDRLRPFGEARLFLDDGDRTDLALKGDGVQSLAAISLIRHYAAETAQSESLILAIEEPEAHLHPRAVHALRAVLEDISRTQQVVLTTHSPLLVNRLDVASNILVHAAGARPAKSVRELREVLGVRISDNLEGADVILVVEGSEDRDALIPLLSLRSARLRRAFESGSLHVQPLYGSGNLNYILSVVRDSLCLTHAFLDDDDAGRAAAQKAHSQGFLAPEDQTFASKLGRNQTELEDLFTVDVYKEAVAEKFNVDCELKVGNAKNRKWSDRMALRFQASGQQWNSDIEADLKKTVTSAVAAKAASALDSSAEPIFAALASALERKLVAARK